MKEDKRKVVFILGPTAVGKSEFGIKIAKDFDGEIISADSVQIYKKLNIGSAKITQKEMSGVVHHGIDLLDPEENFSVYDFVEYTKKKIDEILKKGKLPIVVGGTGLYIKALTLGYNFGGVDKNQALRERLQALVNEKGNEFLFAMLQEKDAKLAAKTDKFNTVRLVRALEIAFSQGQKETAEVDFQPLVIALEMNREKLYEKINARVEEMFKKGLLKEVESLKKIGLTENNQSMRAIGYKEVLEHLNGNSSFEEMVALVKQHTRNYAKRQMTFLRGMNCQVVSVDDREVAFEIVTQKVNDFLKA